MTLYATDLDGTLLNTDAGLSQSTAKLMRSIYSRGIPFTFITARTPATIEPILAAAPPQIPGVAMTGASIWDCRERRYRHVAYHRPDDVRTIARICRSHGVTPFVYTLPRLAHGEPSNSIVVYHEAQTLSDIEANFVHDRTLNDLKTFNLASPAPDATADHTVLFFAMGRPEPIQAVALDIQQSTNCYASWYPDTYNPGIALLEVFTAGVSKASGLVRLKQLTGADRVVAFGDNLNDIPMLNAADVAVAVENAHPEVKAVADIVIGPNTADAVPRYILEAEDKK